LGILLGLPENVYCSYWEYCWAYQRIFIVHIGNIAGLTREYLLGILMGLPENIYCSYWTYHWAYH